MRRIENESKRRIATLLRDAESWMRVVEREDGKIGKVARSLSTTHSSNQIMTQQSEREPEQVGIIKKRVTLDSVPEDVALLIGERVKGWALEGKTIEEKEKATK